jgi:pilus assembly protein CpaE
MIRPMGFMDLFSNKKTSPVGHLPDISNPALSQPHAPKIITFWSSKGGTGKTSVALNVCAYLQSSAQRRVVLIDIDEFGDTGLSAGLEEQYHGAPPRPEDLIPNAASIASFQDLERFLIKEPTTGFYMLMSPKTRDPAFKPTLDGYKKIVSVLARYFDVIAFDCGDRLFDDYTRFALLNCQALVIIVDQGKPTLTNISEVLLEFANPGSGIGKDKMIMVVNKFRDGVGMPMSKVREWFGAAVSTILPIAAVDKDFLRSLNRGDIFILKTESLEIKNQYRDITVSVLEKFY